MSALVQTPYIIGIVGGSASGKTTLARALTQRVCGAALLAEDDYYRCATSYPAFDEATHNFDAPEAKDHALLAAHLRQAKAGKGFESPTYCFKTHTRAPEVRAVAPAPALVLEGLHLLTAPELRAAIDLAAFIETPADVRLARRVRRDVEERGRTAGFVVDQYLRTVRPMHDAHIAPQRAQADIVLDGEAGLQAQLDALIARLPARLIP